MSSWDLRIPAVRDSVQRLVENNEVAEITLCKGGKDSPVAVGLMLVATHRYCWLYGATPLRALEQAEGWIRRRGTE